MAEVESAPPVVVSLDGPAEPIKPPSPGQLKLPTPPATAHPPAAPGAGSIMSKLSSLKERRSTTTPQQAAPEGLIPSVPEHAEPAAAPVAAAPAPAAPAAAPPAKPRTQSSRVPSGAVDAPIQPSPSSKIPNMSPQRMARPAAADSARSASSVERGGSQHQGQGSPGSLSPLRDGGWNQYSRDVRAPRAQALVSGPSDEERAKRKLWAQEKRKKEESRLRADAARRQAEIERKKSDEESRLEARRAFVRERIAKQHEIQARVAAERVTAEERARSELQKFKGKPLHERLIEEYERSRAAEEEAKKRAYEEDILRVKHVRPQQIISGEVVIKPSHSPIRERDISAGRQRQAPVPAGGAAFSAGRHYVPPAGAPAAPAYRSSNGGDYAPPAESPASPAPAAAPHKPFREKPRTQGVVLYSTRPKATPAMPGILPRLVERGASPFVFNSESAPINVPEQTQFWPSQTIPREPEAPNILSVDPGASYDDAPAQASPTELSPTEQADGHASHEENYDDDGFGHDTQQPDSPAMEITLTPEGLPAGAEGSQLEATGEQASAEAGETVEPAQAEEGGEPAEAAPAEDAPAQAAKVAEAAAEDQSPEAGAEEEGHTEEATRELPEAPGTVDEGEPADAGEPAEPAPAEEAAPDAAPAEAAEEAAPAEVAEEAAPAEEAADPASAPAEEQPAEAPAEPSAAAEEAAADPPAAEAAEPSPEEAPAEAAPAEATEEAAPAEEGKQGAEEAAVEVEAAEEVPAAGEAAQEQEAAPEVEQPAEEPAPAEEAE